MAIDVKDEPREEEEPKPFHFPGLGLIKGMLVTLKHLLSRSITQQYPHEKPDLPPRTRGVISLKAENCTVCWKCSRECPDWCIYIESHKETHEPASGGRARSAKVLDRFAIDYALCMYCGICVEVCPFDALFWSPEFEYAEYSIIDMLHEKERLDEWNYTVPPPPELEEGAEPAVSEESVPAESAGGAGVAGSEAFGPPAPGTAVPGEGGPGAPPPTTPADTPASTPATDPPAASAPETPVATPGSSAGAAAGGAPGEPPSGTVVTTTAGEPRAPQAAAPAPLPAQREHVDPDQETYERVLAEEIAKGTSARVAEGRAKAAAIKAARAKGSS